MSIKVKLVILLTILLIITIVVITLKAISPSTNMEITIKCEQLNFKLDDADNKNNIIHFSSFWINEVKLSNFSKITFKGSPAVHQSGLYKYSDKREFTISPASANSYVQVTSQEEAFSLRDMFNLSGALIYWSIEDTIHQYISLRKNSMGDKDKMSIRFSTGDSLHLLIYDCVLTDQKGNSLYETGSNEAVILDIPVSFSLQELNAVAGSGVLETELTSQTELLKQQPELLNGLEIKNVDYTREERIMSSLEPVFRNTVLDGTIRRPAYDLRELVQIQKGDFIKPQPSHGILRSLRINHGSLNVLLDYYAKSLKIGPYKQTEHELVKSEFDILYENDILFIIYTISITLFNLVMNFLKKEKKEDD
jgi:hypothetical protein